MADFKDKYNLYKKKVEEQLESLCNKTEPTGIYEPVRYVITGSGKRIRPLLLILSCEATGGNPDDAVNAAAAIEILHNFTLVHDDIMDNADTRRGRDTVHRKWDNNTAILAGDGLLGFAYKSLLETNSPNIKEIAKSFTEAVIEVCEGQSYDKEFEIKNNVTIEDYIMMIGKKTSELLKCCAEIGGLIGGGTKDEISALKKFAYYTGIAFQIQDDLLDVTGDEKKFGKKSGGDIREGKKTYLMLKALDKAGNSGDGIFLKEILGNKGAKDDKETDKVKNIFEETGVIGDASDAVIHYTEKANKYLDGLKESEAKNMLKWFSEMLLKRSS